MKALLDDRAVAARVLAHVAARTTDLGDGVWREPVEHYRSDDRLQAELALMRRLPVPFCPAAALDGEGAYVAREAAGVPLVAVRDRDGTVLAFRNACRHRGMPVADGQGRTKTFVCRYHGWGYGLDGSLRHVPHEEGFPGLDRCRHGLVPVQAQEAAGLVFISQDGTDAMPEALPPILGPGQALFECGEREVAANWKIFAESFLEGYHIRPTHRESFYPYGFDNLNVIEAFGRNSRVTFPFRRIAKLADVPEAERRTDGLLTYVYHLFPNVLVAVLSRHTSVVVLEPLSTDRTRMVTYGLTNPPAAGEDADPERLRAEAVRDAGFADIGGQEDRDVTCAIQRGLASGANTHFTFGRFEGAIVHFHRMLDAALAAG